jgi:5-methyltetrahydrofolate--homocysteine methyltransferase
MFPASSVRGHYFNHPNSKYFGVGKIAKDRIEDHSARKQQPVAAESENWLTPHLDYWVGRR